MVNNSSYIKIKESAEAAGVKVTELLALSPKNDPFYAGTPTDILQANWFATIWRKAGYTSGVHLRRVHYWTVSQSPPVQMHNGLPYENTEACWKYLTQASKMARYLGLVRIADIIDNKNPPAHVHAHYSESSILSFDLELPNLDEPEINLYGPGNDNAQPYHLEVWAEKSTMNDVLLPVCERYGATLATFEGEVSITACYSLMQRIKSAGEKPVRIWYISDFDPAGNSMPVATARKIEYMLAHYGVKADVRLRPLALNAEQIDEYDLPRIPIKESERRAGKFEAAFGEGACELDALEALYPGVLGRLVDAAVSEYFSDEALDHARTQARAVRDEVRVKRDEILERYEEELEAVRGMIEELNAIEVDTSDYEVERQKPHVDEDDDWMFDSTRPYIQQIRHYKQHKGLIGYDD